MHSHRYVFNACTQTAFHCLTSLITYVQVIVQFRDVNDNALGATLTVPVRLSRDKLEELLRSLLDSEGVPIDDADSIRYTLILNNNQEISTTLEASLDTMEAEASGEGVLNIKYIPLSIYKIRPVTRCSSSLEGKKGTYRILYTYRSQ